MLRGPDTRTQTESIRAQVEEIQSHVYVSPDVAEDRLALITTIESLLVDKEEMQHEIDRAECMYTRCGPGPGPGRANAQVNLERIQEIARLEEENAALKKEKEETCEWVQEDPFGDFSDTWQTDCGNAFVFNEGTPSENDAEFCCYCGKKLVERVADHAEAD